MANNHTYYIGENAVGVHNDSNGMEETISRPSWRQSELDAVKDFPRYREQVSFMNGVEVKYGTKGSVRPDLYKKGSSVDIKNYKIDTNAGRYRLARNIEKQYYKRITHLPKDTKQIVYIDIRGQKVKEADIASLTEDIIRRTKNDITIIFKKK